MHLQDVRVLDLSTLLPGPYATQLLADAGAAVIKIEPPDGGDAGRDMPPLTDRGTGRLFEAVNRGKQSVAIDLRTDAGQEVLARLAADADVVLEQFRPGVVDRLGADYERLRESNEDLVYCSLTGYGQAGPLADRVGHDLNYLAHGGMLHMTRGSLDEAPVPPGYPVADMAGGLFAAFSVVCALLSRELGGAGGEYLDVSMSDAVLSFGQVVMADVLDGDDPTPGETLLTGQAPWYAVYETADGEYVTLAALEPKFWREFCRTIDREDLQDARATAETDDSARAALRAELRDVFRSRTRAEWEQLLGDADAMFAPVRSPSEAATHEHSIHRGIVQAPADRPGWIDFPVLSSAGIGADGGDRAVPDLGEHTTPVLRSCGVEDEQIERYREAGVIS